VLLDERLRSSLTLIIFVLSGLGIGTVKKLGNRVYSLKIDHRIGGRKQWKLARPRGGADWAGKGQTVGKWLRNIIIF